MDEEWLDNDVTMSYDKSGNYSIRYKNFMEEILFLEPPAGFEPATTGLQGLSIFVPSSRKLHDSETLNEFQIQSNHGYIISENQRRLNSD